MWGDEIYYRAVGTVMGLCSARGRGFSLDHSVDGGDFSNTLGRICGTVDHMFTLLPILPLCCRDVKQVQAPTSMEPSRESVTQELRITFLPQTPLVLRSQPVYWCPTKTLYWNLNSSYFLHMKYSYLGGGESFVSLFLPQLFASVVNPL